MVFFFIHTLKKCEKKLGLEILFLQLFLVVKIIFEAEASREVIFPRNVDNSRYLASNTTF